jgi:hypothetical protein
MRLCALFGAALLSTCALAAKDGKDAKDEDAHRFAVIGHSFADGGETRLKRALGEADDKSTAFVLVTGIKGVKEAGRQRLERLSQQRRALERDRAPEPAARAVLRRARIAGRTQAAAHAPVDEPALSQLCRECPLVDRQGAVRHHQPAGK